MRVYVVTMAPQVAGQIVQLPVADNQFVHKGDLLMVIDPTDYKIAVSLAEAAVQQTQANMQNVEKESRRRQELTSLAVMTEEKQTFASNAIVAQAQYQQAVAKSEPGAGESRAHRNPLAGQRLGDEPSGATRRLRNRRAERDFCCRCRFVLG